MPDTDGAGRCAAGLSTLLSGRIRLLQQLRGPAAVVHAPCFGPKVQRGSAGGGEGPGVLGARWPAEDGTPISWEGGGTWEGVPRDQPPGREGWWKGSCWKPFARLYPTPTEGEPAEGRARIFLASGGPCPAQVPRSQPQAGIAAGLGTRPCPPWPYVLVALLCHDDAVALPWLFHVSG